MHEGEVVADRYRLGPRLGRGSMGQVFRARDERLERDVAIKVVDLSATHEPSLADRFHREATATARLNHPNIVTIFDAHTEGNAAYLVMELLPGRPLSEVVREAGPLPVPDAIRIAGLVARALVATHAIGVVHRDIKPANIMIDADQVTLLDFGIAMVTRDAEASLTAPATTVGTAAYMSPEQARGERATPASDVYALGGVLMTMLTGHPPYPGDSALAVLSRHLHDPVPSVRARRPDVPDTVDDLVRRMLAKDPAARPRTADVVRALEHLARNLHPARTPASGPGAATAVLPAVAGAGAGALRPPAAGVASPRPAPASAVPPASGARRAPVSGTTPAPPADARGFRRAALWFALAIAAILVVMVLWALGSSFLGRGTGADAPTGGATGAASPTATPRSTPTTATTPPPAANPLPLPTLPTLPALPTLPGVGELGLDAALRGVDLAIGAIDTGRSKDAEQAQERLAERWELTAERLQEGSDDQAAEALRDFGNEVESSRESGALSRLEAEALLFALSLVERAV